MSNQPNSAPPLVEIGGTIELMGHLFVVASHTTDSRGNTVEVPGICIGKAPKTKTTKPNKRSGPTVASAPTFTTAPAPTTVPAPPITPAPAPPTTPRAAPTTAATTPASQPQRKARVRKPRAAWGGSRRFEPKPPPLQIVYEPWPIGNWVGLIVVIGLIVAGLFAWNAGNEGQKWSRIEGAARAVQPR